MSHRRTRDSQQMERILLRTVQPWELWWQNSPGLLSPVKDLRPILHEEAESALAAATRETSTWSDNIPADLVKTGVETMTGVLIEICNRNWRTEEIEWPTQWLLHSIRKVIYKSVTNTKLLASSLCLLPPGAVNSAFDSRARDSRFDTWSCHLLLFLLQEGKLSVTGESMST